MKKVDFEGKDIWLHQMETIEIRISALLRGLAHKGE